MCPLTLLGAGDKETVLFPHINFHHQLANMDSDSDSTLLWERRHADLVRWRATHGNCNVPKAEGKLGRWVVRQRELHKKGKLEQSRKAHLDALGFVWNTNEAAWETKFALLRDYAAANGHVCVPISDPVLGMWVAKMRANRRKGKLPEHRVRKLDELDFVWNTAEADWMDKFEKLLAFRRKEGHACVPFNEGELGWWVNTQRQNMRKRKLSEERKKLLDDAGFIWNPQEFLAARRREAAHAKARAGADAITSGLFLHEGRKRTAGLAFSSDYTGSPQTCGTVKRFRSNPSSPIALKPVFQSSLESLGTNVTTLSVPVGQVQDQLYLPERGCGDTPVSNQSTQLGKLQRAHSPVAESMTSSRTDRGDVHSIASLLSPSPLSPQGQTRTFGAVPKLQIPDNGRSCISELPSFHAGRSVMACVAGSQRRGPPAHNFVLPPISSLGVFNSPSHH